MRTRCGGLKLTTSFSNLSFVPSNDEYHFALYFTKNSSNLCGPVDGEDIGKEITQKNVTYVYCHAYSEAFHHSREQNNKDCARRLSAISTVVKDLTLYVWGVFCTADYACRQVEFVK